jgi:molecular chaperone DnaK
MAVAVGIDLGTTNTVVAVVRDGVAATIPSPSGRRLIPSEVGFHPSGSVLVGDPAVDRRLIDPESTVFSVKRLIGRAWDAPEVQEARGRFPFELREGPKAGTVVVARGESYSLPEISAFVLRQAKAVAESVLGESVDRAVITVPANFNDLQRAATKMAGRLAGLEVLRILNEPTAAALAYGPQGKTQERIAVYDFGGGTFDVTVLDLAGHVFEVLATAGDTALGGDDIDVVVADRMAEDVLKKHRFDARADMLAYGRLRILAERMKCELSGKEEHTLADDEVVPGSDQGPVRWTYRMTRPELEWASLAIVERTFRVCQQALDAAEMPVSSLDRIVLVGGAARMPMVARKVEQFFGRPPIVRINPDEVVALGAAIQAALLDRSRARTGAAAEHPRISEDSVATELPTEESELPTPSLPTVGAPDSFAPEPDEDLVIERTAGPPTAPNPLATRPPAPPRPPVVPELPAQRPPPAKPSRRVPPAEQYLPARAGRPLVFDVPPEAPPFEVELPVPPPKRRPAQTLPLAVPVPPPAVQAAPQPAPQPLPAPQPRPVAPPPPRRPAPLLIDVTPLSLGVETVGGFCDVLIEANTPVPCDRTRAFTTASDNQSIVQVRVAQGGSQRFDENTFLGEVVLSGITPRARGETEIAVTFEIDADGILNVRARDAKSGRETAARIQLVGAQTDPAEVAAMKARQVAHPLAPLS